VCFLITFSYKESFFNMFFLCVPVKKNGTPTGTAASLAALRLEGNCDNVMFRVYIYNIILTEREHCIKVFRGIC
jgi:hypothetical protein